MNVAKFLTLLASPVTAISWNMVPATAAQNSATVGKPDGWQVSGPTFPNARPGRGSGKA
jgi:hypothetical protein